MNKNNDWYHGAGAEMSFFTINQIAKAYNNMFLRYKHAFFNVFFYYKDGILTMIRKKSEMKALIDYVESLPESYILDQLRKADRLNTELNKKLMNFRMNSENWKALLELCHELWTYNMFCIYFGYAAERKKIEMIREKNYDLVKRVRDIADLISLDNFLKRSHKEINLTQLDEDEITEFLQSGKLPGKDEFEQRGKESLLVMKNLEVRRIRAEKIKDTISKHVEEEDYSTIKEVKGNVAFKKNAVGKARIILKRSELSSIQEGEIVVTLMTDPGYMPYMSKVAGLVTDYGGVTSHAAIISREMGLPCIIATKNATKVFRTGDFIEIDADRGIIKKL